MTWHDDAACAGLPDWMFFPTPTPGTTGEHMYRAGKAVCARCPVRDDCLDDARDADTQWGAHGLRGGLTPGQRAALWGGKRASGSYTIPEDPRRRVHPDDVDELTAQGYSRQQIADCVGVTRHAVDKVIARQRREQVRDDDVSRCACGAWRHYVNGAVCDVCARLEAQRVSDNNTTERTVA